jgi:hypothetical protein
MSNPVDHNKETDFLQRISLITRIWGRKNKKKRLSYHGEHGFRRRRRRRRDKKRQNKKRHS